MMADIHANRQAFEACLASAQAKGYDRLVFLGDFVGYGADPVWVMDKVMDLSNKGAIAVLGNHDQAVSDFKESLNPEAETALSWTRGQLGPEAREFLSTLPMRFEDETRLYVHANVQTYPRWLYIDDAHAAKRALEASRAQTVFCGHVHVPALYGTLGPGKIFSFQPVTGSAIPLPRHRRWLAVLGAVGQSRDGNTAAAYAMLETTKNEITFHRVPYDVQAAVARIYEVGLPPDLAERLVRGR